MRILFLDIDGVLNGHDWDEGARSNRIRHKCVAQLSRILKETDCKIVLSSAWRYMVHCGSMTLSGFEYMLRTHGTAGIAGSIIGVTDRDEQCAYCGYLEAFRYADETTGDPKCCKCKLTYTRADQVTAWLKRNPQTERYVVIDDEDYGFTERDHPLVLTNGKCGLAEADASKAIAILKGATP